MKILLVNSGFGPDMSVDCLPLTMYHISAVLEKAGYETEVFESMFYRVSTNGDNLNICRNRQQFSMLVYRKLNNSQYLQ